MHLNNTHGSVQKHRLVACLRLNEWATSDPALPVVGHVEGIFEGCGRCGCSSGWWQCCRSALSCTHPRSSPCFSGRSLSWDAEGSKGQKVTTKGPASQPNCFPAYVPLVTKTRQPLSLTSPWGCFEVVEAYSMSRLMHFLWELVDICWNMSVSVKMLFVNIFGKKVF